MKKLHLLILASSFLLAGCDTTYNQSDEILVIAKEQHDTNYTPVYTLRFFIAKNGSYTDRKYALSKDFQVGDRVEFAKKKE